MGKIKYSNFESIQEIMGQFDFKHNESDEANKQAFFDSWKEMVGKKIAEVTKPIGISSQNVLIISCANSYIANELFLSKSTFLELIQEKAKELNLEIRDLKFDYKSWVKSNK